MYWEGRKFFKSLFTDERNVCAENPNESARRKPLELIGKLVRSQDTRSKHKNQLHFYKLTINKWKLK